jgi:hypothetical protein
VSDIRPALRIGNAERAAAIKALDEHLAAGRIDHEEYGERMATASMAKTRDDIEPLFRDLPAPHPFAAAPAYPPPAYAPPAQNRYAGPARRVLPWAAVAAAVMALLPFLALALFLLTNVWVFFLLVPVIGAMFGRGRRGGPYGRGPRGRGYWC